MTPEEGRSAREGTRPGRQHRRAEHTLDVLAKGLAGESLSRGQALRMVGGALAGAALAVFVPGVARAQDDGPVNHGPNGPVNSGGTGTCSGEICSEDNECGAGCKCACPHAGTAYWTCC